MAEENLQVLRASFSSQKKHAKTRGIKFVMSFDEWLKVWRSSGKLTERGRGAGKYAMCRKSDRGAYEVGNVYIATNSQNTLDRTRPVRLFSYQEGTLNPLGQHLVDVAGSMGRGSDEIHRIAIKSGLSVHTVQSLALGRKGFFEGNVAKLRKALGKDFKF